MILHASMTGAGRFRELVLCQVEELFKLLESLIGNKPSLEQVLFSAVTTKLLHSFTLYLYFTFSGTVLHKKAAIKIYQSELGKYCRG